MILYIDTTDFSKITFAISANKKIQQKSFNILPHQSYTTVEKLNEFLQKLKIQTLGMKKIVVNKGPGSYTGTRIGVTIGQALGMAWEVPVKFISKDKFKI